MFQLIDGFIFPELLRYPETSRGVFPPQSIDGHTDKQMINDVRALQLKINITHSYRQARRL